MKSGNQLCTRPIFIVGAPRSGTTLLARILNRHCNIFMPSETNFFPDIYDRRKQLGSLSESEVVEKVCERLRTIYCRYNESDEDQKRVDTIFSDSGRVTRVKESLESYRDAFDVFMSTQAEFEGKTRWGNNTPKDLFYVKEILECFPDACFIVCIRDIRDFLTSYRTKWKATSAAQKARLKRLYHPVITTMLWKASARRILRMQSELRARQVLLVQYETFVSEPKEGVRRICEFLGESNDPDLVNLRFSNSSEGPRTSGIYASSVGRWRQHLSGEEVWIAQTLAAGEMKTFGYISESVKVNSLRLTGQLLSTPWALIHALNANRVNTGPIIPYLTRRLGGSSVE